MAHLDSYPHCCGAGILSNFSSAENETTLKHYLHEAKYMKQWGMLHAITNQNQKQTAAALEKLGFQKGLVLTNPVHLDDTTITQWTYDLHKYVPEKKAVSPPQPFPFHTGRPRPASPTLYAPPRTQNTSRSKAVSGKRDKRGRFVSASGYVAA